MSTKSLPQQRLKTHSMSGREGPEEACSSSRPFYRWGNQAPGRESQRLAQIAQNPQRQPELQLRCPSSRSSASSRKEAREGWWFVLRGLAVRVPEGPGRRPGATPASASSLSGPPRPHFLRRTGEAGEWARSWPLPVPPPRLSHTRRPKAKG